MDWKAFAALGVMGLALVAWLLTCIVTSVNRYARRFATEERDDKRRGFEVTVKKTTTDTPGPVPAVQREKDDHHG